MPNLMVLKSAAFGRFLVGHFEKVHWNESSWGQICQIRKQNVQYFVCFQWRIMTNWWGFTSNGVHLRDQSKHNNQSSATLEIPKSAFADLWWSVPLWNVPSTGVQFAAHASATNVVIHDGVPLKNKWFMLKCSALLSRRQCTLHNAVLCKQALLGEETHENAR